MSYWAVCMNEKAFLFEVMLALTLVGPAVFEN
jgi:hypothetical protein